MRDARRVAVLISGRGSNMRSLVEQADGYDVVLVASNRPDAAGLDWAKERGIPTWASDSRGVDRESFDAAIGKVLDEHQVGTVALAGYMRILSAPFVQQWAGRIVNIHPSLLPKHRGLDTHARAIEAGDSVSGCTVHVVTEELDAGEIIAAAQVPIAPGETPQSLERHILAEEHKLYPKALKEFVSR